MLDQAGKDFVYEDCQNEYWNPEEFSLLFDSPLWHESNQEQRVKLNQLYWVAYYSQIISAEIATIFFNQVSAAGLYGLEDFRLVCDTLDFESMQERAHIDAFKKVTEQFEKKVFGERIFTYPMRPYYAETMIFQKTNWIKKLIKRAQLQGYTFLASSCPFIACQYLTVRGLRTLNGKIIQHQLSEFYSKNENKESAPIPSKISYYHFMDESYHFNSSRLIGSEVIKVLKRPNKIESHIANMAINGSLVDHSHFNITVNGIFWYEPAIFSTIYKLLRTPIFKMNDAEATRMLERCFCEDNQSIHNSLKTHQIARDSYRNYLEDLSFVTASNRQVTPMEHATVESYLQTNRTAFKKFIKSEKYHVA